MTQKYNLAIFIAVFSILLSLNEVASRSLGSPRNCEEVQAGGSNQSGVYTIYPTEKSTGVEVYCDLVTDGGGWTLFQRRKQPLESAIDFERTWEEYENGFGILADNHWLGLHIVSALTQFGDSVLRIDMMDWDDQVRFARYSSFKVAKASELYKLSVGGYSGDAGDSLSYHNEMSFTTKDRDNDEYTDFNCARMYHGAWWYKSCYYSNLNGIFIEDGRNVTYPQHISWTHWHGAHYSLKRTEMKIRSRNFRTNE